MEVYGKLDATIKDGSVKTFSFNQVGCIHVWMYDSIQMLKNFLYLFVSTCAVIGPFCGLYSTVRPAKFYSIITCCLWNNLAYCSSYHSKT